MGDPRFEVGAPYNVVTCNAGGVSLSSLPNLTLSPKPPLPYSPDLSLISRMDWKVVKSKAKELVADAPSSFPPAQQAKPAAPTTARPSLTVMLRNRAATM